MPSRDKIEKLLLIFSLLWLILLFGLPIWAIFISSGWGHNTLAVGWVIWALLAIPAAKLAEWNTFKNENDYDNW